METSSVILIIDDDAAGRRALEAPLINEGYTLIFARDGAEALQLAAQHQPDVTLLDVMLPGMDGYEVCRRMRADPLLAEAPIIMVTALDDRQSRLQGLEAGADDFVSKPFDRAELRTRVRTIVRLNRYRSLYAERAQFRWLVDTASDGYALLDAAGMLVYCNGPAAALLNLDPANLPAASFLEIANQQYHCEPEMAWRNWLEASPDPATPRFLVRPATSLSPAFWLSVDVLAPPRGKAAYVVRLRDVTQQVTEQRDLNSFRTAIQHKLRTPLAHMTMGATLLSVQQPPEGIPSALAEYVSIVQNAATSLSRQIDDLVEYSNLTPAGEASPETTLADLLARARRIGDEVGVEHLAVTSAVADMQALAPLTGRAVDILLMELLENARKFHPAQAPHVTISLHPGDEQSVLLRVEDDGVTLAPDQLERAWQPYYQAEKGFSGNTPGMGLGLSIVASLVWNVGGRYRLHNRQPGPGIVAEIMLPIHR